MAVTRSPSIVGDFLRNPDDLLPLSCAGAAKNGAGAGLRQGRLPYDHRLVRRIAPRSWSSFDQAWTNVMVGRNRPRSRASFKNVDLFLLHICIRPVIFRAEVEVMRGRLPCVCKSVHACRVRLQRDIREAVLCSRAWNFKAFAEVEY